MAVFQEEKVLTLPFAGDPEMNLLLSDGLHLYLVVQPEPIAPEESHAKDKKAVKADAAPRAPPRVEAPQDATFVHVFDYTSAGGVLKRRTVQLGNCVPHDASPAEIRHAGKSELLIVAITPPAFSL